MSPQAAAVLGGLCCALAAGALAGCGGAGGTAAAPRPDAPDRSVMFRELRCAEIVGRIEGGELVPGADGAVTLPDASRELSADGRAYITRRPDGKLFVLFPLSLKMASLDGALYTNPPLDDGDVTSLAGGRFVIRTVNGPGGSIDLDLKLELREDWALVNSSP